MTALAFADPVFEIAGGFPPDHAGDGRAGDDSRLRRGAGAAGAARTCRRGGFADAGGFRDRRCGSRRRSRGAVAAYLTFHTGAPLAPSPDKAAFALVDLASDGLRLDRFAQGSAEYPDRSTTVVAQDARLSEGPALRLAGPGVHGEAELRAASLPARLCRAMGGQSPPLPARRRLDPRGRREARLPAALGRHLRGDALMYVAVKGGERAIANAHALLADERRGDRAIPEISPSKSTSSSRSPSTA